MASMYVSKWSMVSSDMPNHVKSKILRAKYNNNNNKYITSIALKSSGVRARKRNKTKSLIKFKNRGHIGVIISKRGRRGGKAILNR